MKVANFSTRIDWPNADIIWLREQLTAFCAERNAIHQRNFQCRPSSASWTQDLVGSLEDFWKTKMTQTDYINFLLDYGTLWLGNSLREHFWKYCTFIVRTNSKFVRMKKRLFMLFTQLANSLIQKIAEKTGFFLSSLSNNSRKTSRIWDPTIYIAEIILCHMRVGLFASDITEASFLDLTSPHW